MTNGTVKFFNAAKGFGFITPDGGGKDVFVPAASVAASGVSSLKTGQLVSFETEPDSKGPKAVNLKVLADVPVPKPVKEHPAPRPTDAGRPTLTVFHDPDLDESRTVLAALRAAGHDPRVIDYIATPPTRDELKSLSMLLRGGDQSLVRRYEPLFQELRLDDRFISDTEFWDAIVEHPFLINGPVIATAQKARICRSENAVKSFLGIDLADAAPMATKPKAVPESLAVLMKSGVAPAPAVKAEEAQNTKVKPTRKARPETGASAPKQPKTQAKTKTTVKAKATVKAAVQAKATVQAKAKTGKTTKTTKPTKDVSRKPVKKVGRALKK